MNKIDIYNDKDWQDDFSTLCICAVRYSLGRMTYMPSLVQQIITENIDLINDNGIIVMIRDVEEYGGVNHDRSVYGADFDYRDWMKFRDKLKSVAKERGL